MEAKKIYTRAEKIAYYARRIAYLEMALDRNKSQLSFARNRLKELQDDETYQDWDSSLARELENKKAPR